MLLCWYSVILLYSTYILLKKTLVSSLFQSDKVSYMFLNSDVASPRRIPGSNPRPGWVICQWFAES